jgi:hypothetical protein
MRAPHLPLLSALPLLAVLAATPAGADTIIRDTDINADLTAADKPCLPIDDLAQKVECFNRNERAVWLKETPQTIDSFDLFAAYRIQLTNQVVTGSISWGQYMRGFRAAASRLRVYKTSEAQR